MANPKMSAATLRALRWLLKTRSGNVTLAGVTGAVAGYPVMHAIRPKVASALLPEGYYVEPRYRVYKDRLR